MLKTIHPNSVIGQMCTPHLVERALIAIKRIRCEQLSDADLHSLSHGLQILLLELEDREEWKIATGLRRKIAGTRGISVF